MSEVEFRKAIIPDEIPTLCEFDRLTFPAHPKDWFTPEQWKRFESHWMILNGQIIGCASFEPSGQELWIANTAILPEFRNQGFGKRFKQWQIDYAQSRGFARLATVMRRARSVCAPM